MSLCNMSFQGAGYTVSRSLIPKNDLVSARRELDANPRVVTVEGKSKAMNDPYLRSFDRVMNLWTEVSSIRRLVYSPVLIEHVKDLLNCDALRLSHDQCLFKQPKGDGTPIHADQYHWPVSSEKTVTAWIPLQNTPCEMGSLAFYRGSHLLDLDTRAFLSTCKADAASEYFRNSSFPLDSFNYELGDVSFHLGWTFHTAGPNSTSSTRKVLTISYMEDGIKLIQSRPEVTEAMLKFWCPGCRFGQELNSELNPKLS